MSPPSILRSLGPIEPRLVDGRLPWSSCDRGVLGWYERPQMIRGEMNLALDARPLGPGQNGTSRPLDNWKACRRSLAPGLAISRFHQDQNRFPRESAVEVQHASW
jgi:hypothetical protein